MLANTKPIPDTLTLGGANALVEKIRAFWQRRDMVANVWVEKHGDVFVVRSDMMMGQP